MNTLMDEEINRFTKVCVNRRGYNKILRYKLIEIQIIIIIKMQELHTITMNEHISRSVRTLSIATLTNPHNILRSFSINKYLKRS